jgi:hypothetical protein
MPTSTTTKAATAKGEAATATSTTATTFTDTAIAHHIGLSFWGLKIVSLGRAHHITFCINLSSKV